MNWSLTLNVLLLLGVTIMLVRTFKKKQPVILALDEKKPILTNLPTTTDDIISIRKICTEATHASSSTTSPLKQTFVLFLLAKPNRHLAGYEMLQTILSTGLRFGEGQLFHYHQMPNGQGPILCSLAAATSTGTFDLPNIGAFNAKGLCLFMHLSSSPALDHERFDKMVETAQQLAEGLDAYLLDDQKRPFTNETKTRYLHQLETTAS